MVPVPVDRDERLGLFEAYTPPAGYELWRTNGAVTVRIADINHGSNSAAVHSFTPMNGWLYFAATTPDTGHELWRTNGAITERLAQADQ